MSGERAVLFDFGGVLLRQDWTEYDVFGERHGLPPGALSRALYGTDAWRALQVGRGDRGAWAEAAVASLREHCGDHAESVFREWRARPVQRHEPNVALARALRAAGARVGLLSNAAPDLDELIVSHFGVDIDWDARVISGLDGLAKPDPAIYRLAAERIGVPAERCFFIDDLDENVEAARATGMTAHRFRGDYAALHEALRAAGYRWDEGATP